MKTGLILSMHFCNFVLKLSTNHSKQPIVCLFQLTQNAVNDYNRSRSYLADLANRDGVPVLEDIEEAVNCTVRRLKEIRELESSGPF